METIPKLNQQVKYLGKIYTIKKVDLGGKCDIQKMLLPDKGKILRGIDISELKTLS
jgi:hypothetical protein